MPSIDSPSPTHLLRHRVLAAAWVAGGLTLLAAAPPTQAVGGHGCDLRANARGNDSAAGTARRPFRTVQRLVDALRPGQIGCIASGSYAENVTISNAGTAEAPLTVQAAPRATANLCGHIEFKKSARYWTLRGLRIDGSCSDQQTVQVFANRVRIVGNDITNHHEAGSCVFIGSHEYGVAHSTAIGGNRIHDCGNNDSTAGTHGIYVSASRDARITNNVIVRNAAFGIQLYDDAQGTLVSGNIIDGNGRSSLFIGGDEENASDRNIVVYNILSNPRRGYNLDSWWGGSIPSRNVARRNCLWRGADGNVGPEKGFTASANVFADPLYADRVGDNYRLRVGSPCTKARLRFRN